MMDGYDDDVTSMSPKSKLQVDPIYLIHSAPQSKMQAEKMELWNRGESGHGLFVAGIMYKSPEHR